MNPKHQEQAYHLAGIGYWELDLQNSKHYWNEKLYWSDNVKHLHEVPLDYQPTLEDAVVFYEEGENRQKIQAAVENAIENGESYVIESKIITAEGNHRWVRSIGEPVFKDGQCIKLYGSTQDITDLKSKELKIKAQQIELQMFLENSLDGIMITSPDGSIHRANKAMCEMLGMEEDKILNLGRDGLVYNDQKLQKALKRREETGKFSGELTFIHKSGKKIPIELTTSVYKTPQGEPRTSMVIRDITERIKLNQELKKSLERYHFVTKATYDAIWDWNLVKDTIFWGEGFETLFGYDLDNLSNDSSSWTDHIHPDDKDWVFTSIKKVIDGSKRNWFEEYRYLHADGSYRFVEDRGYVIRNEEGVAIRMIGAMRDVTDRKVNELEIEKAYAEKETILESIDDGFFAINSDWIVTYWNSAAERLLDTPKKKVLHKNLWSVFDDALDLPSFTNYRKVMDEGVTVHFEDYYSPLDRWYDINAYPSEDGISVYFKNITEQKEREKQLREINRKNRLILESTAEGIYGIDTEGKCTFINEAASNILGYRSEECIGKNMHELIHHKYANGEHYPESECPIFISKNDHESCRGMDEVFWRADGSFFDVEYTSNPMIEDGEIKGAVVAFSDITKRKQHERALQDSLKEKETLLMEIHHRVKNNLAVVSGLLQLQAFGTDDEMLSQKLNDSVSRIKTMASIHELLYNSNSFSRVAADKIIEKLITEIAQTYQPKISLTTKFDLQNIELNINQAIPLSLIINEVVTNILKHAFTGRDQGNLAVSILESNQKVSFRITDNGNGLPKNFPDGVNTESLGLQLIDTLSSQLQADYKYETADEKTHFNLTFQKAEVKGKRQCFGAAR
ncbi:MAG: PAS domain S-box protein [Gracilimonas sp.]|nr:PAS domain S-box protein [Gracilimonas sp.]